MSFQFSSFSIYDCLSEQHIRERLLANFKKTTLWVSAFESDEAISHKDSVKTLEGVFDKVRENAKVLVSQIAIDLPGYTVHDITHLDALWEVGSGLITKI